MDFIGIDPSLRYTGLVHLADSGVEARAIGTRSRLPLGNRLLRLRQELLVWLEGKPPSLVFIEGPSYNSESKKHTLGAAWGTVLTVLAERGFTYRDIPPLLLKKFVTGNTAATKPDMAAGLEAHFNLNFTDEHQVDAAGLALLARAVETDSWYRRCEGEVVQGLRRDRLRKPK